jgi:putative glycosyltransferase
LIERYGGHLAWGFLNLFLTTKIPHSSSNVRLMTREYVDALVRHKEHKTAIGGLMVMTGFKQKGLEFEKGFRGTTSYSMSKRLVALLDSITSFSELPLFLVFYIGCAVILVSIVLGGFLIVRHVQGHLLEGWASTMVAHIILRRPDCFLDWSRRTLCLANLHRNQRSSLYNYPANS